MCKKTSVFGRSAEREKAPTGPRRPSGRIQARPSASSNRYPGDDFSHALHIQCCSALDFLQRSIKTCLLSISRRADVRPPPADGVTGATGVPNTCSTEFSPKIAPFGCAQRKAKILWPRSGFFGILAFFVENRAFCWSHLPCRVGLRMVRVCKCASCDQNPRMFMGAPRRVQSTAVH